MRFLEGLLYLALIIGFFTIVFASGFYPPMSKTPRVKNPLLGGFVVTIIFFVIVALMHVPKDVWLIIFSVGVMAAIFLPALFSKKKP